MDAILELPFRVFHPVSFRLPFNKNLLTPPPMVVFGLVFFTYFLFCSGIIYDVITETPSIGSEKDPRTGAVKPVAVMAGRINSQFIIEGLTASVLFCLGGIGIMLLDQAAAKDVSETNRTILLGIAGLCLFIAYNVLGVFIRLKVPGYMR